MRKHQKRLSRQQPGSKRYKKTKAKIGRFHEKLANVRRDYCHQTSRKLVDSEASILVWEALPIPQMTKRATPKQDETGNYLPNRASAKSGLNEAIMSSCWGQILRYVGYKAKAKGKLVLVLSAYQSSQECVRCHHTHPTNRVSQSVFVCQGCGYKANADKNAADVMKYRGIKALQEVPQEYWEEPSVGSGIWKLKKTPVGTRGSAHGGKGKTPKQQAEVQSQRSANRVVALQ